MVLDDVKDFYREYGFPVLLFTIILLLSAANYFPEETETVKQLLLAYGNAVIVFTANSNFLPSLILVALGVTVPIFVLTVTLVGRAAKISKKKQSEHNQKAQEDKKKKIINLQKRIAHEPDNIVELESDVTALKEAISKLESDLKSTEARYDSLGFDHAVLRPVLAFILSFFSYSVLAATNNISLQVVSFFASISFLAYGAKKLFVTLNVVQEVSLTSDEEKEKELRSLITERLVGGFVEALKVLEKEKEPIPVIRFENDLPLVLEKGEENEVRFLATLDKSSANEADDIDIFIAFPPEIEIIPRKNYSVKKQSKNFIIPEANSVFFKIEHLKKFTNRSLNVYVKPEVNGTFQFKYRVLCRGHSETLSEGEVIV